MKKKRRSKNYDVELGGITIYSEETTYEQNSIFGIGFGEEKEVSRKRKILPMNKDTRDTLVAFGGGIIGKKLLKK